MFNLRIALVAGLALLTLSPEGEARGRGSRGGRRENRGGCSYSYGYASCNHCVLPATCTPNCWCASSCPPRGSRGPCPNHVCPLFPMMHFGGVTLYYAQKCDTSNYYSIYGPTGSYLGCAEGSPPCYHCIPPEHARAAPNRKPTHNKAEDGYGDHPNDRKLAYRRTNDDFEIGLTDDKGNQIETEVVGTPRTVKFTVGSRSVVAEIADVRQNWDGSWKPNKIAFEIDPATSPQSPEPASLVTPVNRGWAHVKLTGDMSEHWVLLQKQWP